MTITNSKDTKTKGAVATSATSDNKTSERKPASKIESENTDKAGKVTTSKK